MAPPGSRDPTLLPDWLAERLGVVNNLVICCLHYLLLSNVRSASNLLGQLVLTKLCQDFKQSAPSILADMMTLHTLSMDNPRP